MTTLPRSGSAAPEGFRSVRPTAIRTSTTAATGVEVTAGDTLFTLDTREVLIMENVANPTLLANISPSSEAGCWSRRRAIEVRCLKETLPAVVSGLPLPAIVSGWRCYGTQAVGAGAWPLRLAGPVQARSLSVQPRRGPLDDGSRSFRARRVCARNRP
jgi:hypothetical protein